MNRLLRILLLSVLSLGCLTLPRRAIVTGPGFMAPAPASPAAVAQCRHYQGVHDTWATVGVVAGVGGGASSGVAGVLPPDDSTARTGLAISGVVFGALATLAAGEAGLAASSFAAFNCATVLQ